MAGKATLLLVMGFSLIFLIFGHNFNSMSTRTVENYTDYYKETVLHDLAVTGANLGASAVFLNNSWTTGYNDLELNGGTIDVTVEIVDAGQNIRKIISEAEYDGKTSTVEVTLSPSRFSKYAYFSESEGSNIWWTGKDTVYGPFHTQDNLRADNHPVFGVMGYRTTIKGKIIYHDYYEDYGINEPTQSSSSTKKSAFNKSKTNDKPIFHGSFEAGVDEPLVTNGLQPLRDAAADDGYKINLSSSTTIDSVWDCDHYWIWPKHTSPCGDGDWDITTTTIPDTVYVTFLQDSVNIKMGYDKPDTTYRTSDIAPNGVIYAEGMDIRLQGTVEGQYSVLSDGTIHIDDDIIYKTDPKTNPNSTDLLGILAQDDIYITDNNSTTNIKIHGALYCQDGGFGAENHDGRSVDGDINLLGGITQHIRRAVGTYSGSTSTHGFNKKYRYDDRLMKLHPPFFPTTQGFSIVSWKE